VKSGIYRRQQWRRFFLRYLLWPKRDRFGVVAKCVYARWHTLNHLDPSPIAWLFLVPSARVPARMLRPGLQFQALIAAIKCGRMQRETDQRECIDGLHKLVMPPF